MPTASLYSTMPATCSPEQGLPVSTAELTSQDWFTAPAAPFNTYMTPYPTAPLDSHKWTPQASSQFPAFGMTQYPSLPVQNFLLNAPARPRSSPSTFGPAPESINWHQSSGLGIQYENEAMHNGMMPPSAFDHMSSLHQLSAPNTPELRQPVPKRPYASIAPIPSMSAPSSTGKRARESTVDSLDLDGSRAKRKRTASVNSADLSEDDRYLVQLKEDESLPWKDIATRFQADKGKSFQVAALQMRYKRLREKFRVWDDQDLNALKLAHEYWQKYKWEIISQKMTEFGNPDRWSARNCSRKWQEMELLVVSTMSAGPPPSSLVSAMNHYSTSPIDQSVHYSFVPLQ